MYGINSRTRNSVPKRRLDYYQELDKAQLKMYKSYENFVYWVNSQGNQCRRIIQPNRCFCHHSFLLHNNQSLQNFAKCLAPGCKCNSYQYVPYYDIKCMCRHSYKYHSSESKKCQMCRQCLGFLTNWSCKCGMKYQLHKIEVKRRERKGQIEREKIMTNERVKIITTEGRGKSEGIKTIGNYSNSHSKENFQFENSFEGIDQRSYEMAKFDKDIERFDKNEQQKEEIRKKQIERVNKKFGHISFEKSVQKMMMGQINEMGLKPREARQLSALELIIKPHNYTPVKMQKYLSLLRKRNKVEFQIQK